MGKVVILGGNARSGKSTLAYKLVARGFSRISFDNLNEAIKEGLGINLDELSKDKKFLFFEKIVDKAIEESELENINTVIDMYDYLPEDINKLKNKSKLEVYFLAYPNCTLDEIKFNIVYYAKPTDWIANVNEEYLISCAQRFYDRNKLLFEECKKYHMKLIDTKSGDERIKTIDDLFKSIIEV